MLQLKQNQLIETMQKSKVAFWYVGGFSLVINILMLTVPVYMLQLFDRVLASHRFETLIYLTTIAIVAILIMSLLDMVRAKILVQVSSWLDNNLSPYALELSADELLKGKVYGAQCLKDTANVRTFLCGTGIFAFFDSPWVPIYILVVYLLHPTLGFIALIGTIILFSLALLNEIATRKPLAEANAKSIESQREAELAMRNVEVIQSMGMLSNVVNSWFSKNQTVLEQQGIANSRGAIILGFSKFCRLVLQISVLGFGAYLVVQGEITPGVMIAASILMSRALAPVEQAIGAWKQMVAAKQAYLRLKQHFAQASLRQSGLTLPTPKGKINFEQASYAPPGSFKPILKAINFELNPGESVAVIGPTAAGKTTLARLMVGTWKANAGSVRLDGADVYGWDREDFGQHVGYLPQDVELFHGSIKENIARMGDGDNENVIEAAKIAGVHDLILHLPNGYDTVIGSDAYQLSGGQRQRIALARALYGNPKLLVLDEPNSSLDNDGDQALSNALVEMKKRGCTVAVIAHRPAVLRVVDKVLLLQNGAVQFFGNKEEFMQQLPNTEIRSGNTE